MSTGVLNDLDNPAVVQTTLRKDGRVSVHNIYVIYSVCCSDGIYQLQETNIKLWGFNTSEIL